MRIQVYDARGVRSGKREELAGLLADPDLFLWVDVEGPSDADADLLLEVFRFHPLAVEDTRNQRQRPKVEEYDDHLFVILNPVECPAGEVVFRELDLFLGKNFAVTVHPAAEPAIDEAERRLNRFEKGKPSAGQLVWALADTVVDGYFPVLDAIDERLAELEDRLLAKPRPAALEELFGLKRSLLELRRVVAPQRDMINVLSRPDYDLVESKEMRYRMRDVYDHLLRVTDMVDTFRDLLTSAVDLYMSAVSNHLNRVVHRLTVVTVIFGSFAVITGFYGMNFALTWPPFDARWGVPAALVLMVGSALALWRIFGHKDEL
ncbi:MAG: magnesium/cobalt transporter CorA [Thermoanaerobaculia bacterium]